MIKLIKNKLINLIPELIKILKTSIFTYINHIKYMIELHELYICVLHALSPCIFLKTNRYQEKK